MNLVSIRIITEDVSKLLAFYEHLTGVKGTRFTDDFAEVQTAYGTLAIGSTRTLALFGRPEVAKAAENHSAIIEFITGDVDHIYREQSTFLAPYLVQEPTTMPGATAPCCSVTRMGTWSISLPLPLPMPEKNLRIN